MYCLHHHFFELRLALSSCSFFLFFHVWIHACSWVYRVFIYDLHVLHPVKIACHPRLSSCYCCCCRVCGIFPIPFDLILSIYTAKCVLNIHKEIITRRMRTTPIKNHIQQKAISDNKAFQFMISSSFSSPFRHLRQTILHDCRRCNNVCILNNIEHCHKRFYLHFYGNKQR